MRLTGSAITVPGAASIATPSCIKAAFSDTMESRAARSCDDNSAIRSDRPSVNTEASERTFSPSGKSPDNSGTKKPSTKTRRRAGGREFFAQRVDCYGAWAHGKRQGIAHERAQVGVMPRLDAPVRQPRCTENSKRVRAPFGHVRVAGKPGLGSVEGAGEKDFGGRSRRYDVSGHCHFLLGDGRFGDIIVVSAFFQLDRQFFAPAADNPTLRHHMHGVRHHVVENTLVMGNDEETAAWRSQRIDAISDHTQGVDVEA